MKKVILIGLALVMAAVAVSAEELVLTVDEAVAMALQENLGLQQEGITLRTKERAKDSRWNSFLPAIGVSAGFNGANRLFTDQGQAPPSFGDNGSLGFTAGAGLDLRLNSGIAAASKQIVTDYEAGLLDYESARKDLERQVRKQFYFLLANERNIAIQQADIDLAEQRLDQARNNFANGLVPELEVLSNEVALVGLYPAYDGVVASQENFLQLFKFLIGQDRDVDITLTGDLDTELYDLDAEELIDRYIAQRLDLRSIDKQIMSLEYQKSATAQNLRAPTLSLGYSYSLSGRNGGLGSLNPNGWSDNWSDSGALNLVLSWSLDGFIPGSSSDVTIKGIQDGIDSLQLAKQQAFENAGIEITNLVNDLATSRRTIEATESSVELARRNFELTEEAYNVGTREFLDVQNAQNEFRGAAQQLLLAKYEYIAGLLDLEYAVNAPMEEFLN